MNLDTPKPENVPQEQWDRMRDMFDKIYDDDSDETQEAQFHKAVAM